MRVVLLLAALTIPACTSKTGVSVENEKFRWDLDLQTFKAIGMANKLTGEYCSLGHGEELAVYLDASDARIELGPWKRTVTSKFAGFGSTPPERDPGYEKRYFSLEVDDADWETSPVVLADPSKHVWGRTRFRLPDAAGRPVHIVLGGHGLNDADWMRIFLNGTEIGTRVESGFWREPRVFRLETGDKAYGLLKFGDDNLLVLQMKGMNAGGERLRRLKNLDSRNRQQLPQPIGYQSNFDQYVTIGEPMRKVSFGVTSHRLERDGDSNALIVEVQSQDESIQGEVRYTWREGSPTLRKFVSVANRGTESVRVLDVDLGNYHTGGTASEGGEGFPVHVNEQLFFGIAHPAGLVQGGEGRVRLREFPAAELDSGQELALSEVVIGVAERGGSAATFRNHIQERSRRIRRGHDKPYALLMSYGSWERDEHGDWHDEQHMLGILDGIEEMKREQKLDLDGVSIGFFWDTKRDYSTFYRSGKEASHLIVDYKVRDLEPFRRSGWPNGPVRLFERSRQVGVPIMIGFEAQHAWECSRNPDFAVCSIDQVRAGGPSGSRPTGLCRGSRPYGDSIKKSMVDYARSGFVSVLIQDGMCLVCRNTGHGHETGKYSTRSIFDAAIDTWTAVDKENPDILIMGQGCYSSPWWLLWMDNIWDPGLLIEAGQPSHWPTRHQRDSVTRILDQAEWYTSEEGDIPSLLKDSLGVWLSPTSWNSKIGKERWQEGFVMDICRGSLMAQIWTHPKWLTTQEREDLAHFVGLLKAHPECFRNRRFILGNPWQDELYGYLGFSGNRGFIALNNGSPRPSEAFLELDAECSFKESGRWKVRRHWPRDTEGTYRNLDGDDLRLTLEPWEITLLEVVRH